MKISHHIDIIKQRVRAAEQQYHRPLGSVHILAVTKSQPVESIKTAFHAGQLLFGENYLQEALPKINELRDLPIEWHFIGRIQSNKTRLIANHFSWVQSIDNLKQAQLLNQYRPIYLPKLNICIQVNISRSSNKSGVDLEDLPELMQGILDLERLQLRGLMTIPEVYEDFSKKVTVYQQLRSAQLQLSGQGLLLDTLSMGMTHDFEAAVAAGSTLVRIGTGIFGTRDHNPKHLNTSDSLAI